MTTPRLTFHGRLPGVDCQPALPAGPTAVRLDVAGFVGFAERGPLDLPVAVEDVNQYRAVFGSDLVLATEGGTPVYANLPGAVQAFFDNGGRRCYVVRVAGPDAGFARWAVPGMRLWQPDGTVDSVYLRAAWPGNWSAGFGTGTQLLSQPLAVVAPYRRAAGGEPGLLRLTAGSVLLLGAGDLLRLDLGPGQPGLYITVQAVDRGEATVRTAVEVAFLPEASSPPAPEEQLLLGPAAVAALPPNLPVRAAWRLRLDLVAREVVSGTTQLLERWPSLGFNRGTATWWLDVVQPADDDMPDQQCSMLLRADRATVDAATTGVILPVGMDRLGTDAEFTEPAGGPPPVAGMDGLATYRPADMFLDPDLRQESVDSLLTDADQLTVLAKKPRRLKGIHSLLAIDEVALVSVPDAVHLGWSPAVPPPPPAVPASPPAAPPPDRSDFRDCTVPEAPEPPVEEPPPPPPVATYPILDEPAGYDPTGLLEVHNGLIQMCAARNDMFAVLGVPRHFDTADVLAWLQRITADARPSQAGRIVLSPLSFAGFWHPWIRVVEPTTPALAPLREQPPDGAVCGTIAAHELRRGVWIAPAAVPLRGPVGLARALPGDDMVRLFDEHTNLLRAAPGSISAWSAHTLAADPTLGQVSVRRLIILLRKIALLEGGRYAFDPNTDRFRQLVRLRFERILAALTRLGALAAYQVVTDGSVNTPNDIDNGRLIVSLLVAPTIPIEFITISLVRAGEGLLDVVLE